MKRELERLREKLTPEEDQQVWSELRGALREGRGKKSIGNWLAIGLHGRYAMVAGAAVVVLVALAAGFGPRLWNRVAVPVDRVAEVIAPAAGEKRGVVEAFVPKGAPVVEAPVALVEAASDQVGEAQADPVAEAPPFIDEMIADVTTGAEQGKKRLATAAVVDSLPKSFVSIVPGDDPGVIAGTVRDAVTGDPLYPAFVIIAGVPGIVTTEKDGSFRIEGVPDGSHRIIVQMSGYGDEMVAGVDVADGLMSDVSIWMETGISVRRQIRTISSPVKPNKITGFVLDRSTGKPLYPANVLVMGERWGTMTAEDGSFEIAHVPPGSYRLMVQMMGFANATESNVLVSDDLGATVYIGLESTVALELSQIEITGQRKRIDRLEQGTRHSMSAQDLSDLPVDDIDETISLQGGIAQDGELHFRGGHASEVQYQVDGVPVKDPLVGGQAVKIPTPSSEELSRFRSLGYVRGTQGRNPKPPTEPTWGGIRDLYGSSEEQRSRTGGTATVNDELADDMFFEHAGVNPFIDAAEDALSTFSLDVDTGSYTLCRRYINEGSIPPEAAVRVEEFINYFTRDYAPPEEDDFSIQIDGMPSPFAHVDDGTYQLLRIGIRGRVVEEEARRPAQIALVIDTSGSMRDGGRLELVKDALEELIDELRPSDRVGIVTFGSAGRVLLPMQKVRGGLDLQRAIQRLRPGGSTNAAQGLDLGYEMLRENARRDWIHRVIFLSDGVANQGITGFDEILDWVKRDSDQITLTTIGVGMGNYNDVLMERLADAGDGQYAYVDDHEEALRVLRDNLTGTLEIIARNTKAQIEFNPERVARYRLLGYENRAIRDQDFRNNRVDAGEIGAGHEVTALYEVKLAPKTRAGRLADVRLRYEIPFGDRYIELKESVRGEDLSRSVDSAPDDLIFDACVAEFAEILRGSYWASDSKTGDVLDLLDELPRSMRRREEIYEFIRLVERVEELED